MKKNYIIPTLEIVAVVTADLLQENPVSNKNFSGSGHNSFGNGAPKRKLF
jgi:hypothetical protein